MRSTLLLAVLMLLLLGVVFARDRLKLAFRVGIVLYLVLMVFRFLVFGRSDWENADEVVGLLAVFGLIWLAGWLITGAILRQRRVTRTEE